MSTISRWIVPSYFSEENRKSDPIVFDLSKHLKLILFNEVWNRKYDYGFSTGLKNTNPNEIKRAGVTIYPRFFSGYVNEKRIPEIIESLCGKLPTYLKLDSFQDWPYQNGCAIIEVEYKSKVANIPVKKDFDGYIPKWDIKFMELYHQHLAVLKEISSFFLAGLHISFPTQSAILRSDAPINDGFCLISSGRRKYGTKISTGTFMHEILIETSKLSNVKNNLDGLSLVWHYNLWPLKRYLKAVESDQISMDNLLDLIFALEGMFEKNASSEFIKTMCMIALCETKKDAKQLKSLLDLAYRLRNDIVHGERSYDTYDYVKLQGKEILAQDVYWKMKSIVAVMLIKAISKTINNNMKTLRFIDDDLLDIIYTK